MRPLLRGKSKIRINLKHRQLDSLSGNRSACQESIGLANALQNFSNFDVNLSTVTVWEEEEKFHPFGPLQLKLHKLESLSLLPYYFGKNEVPLRDLLQLFLKQTPTWVLPQSKNFSALFWSPKPRCGQIEIHFGIPMSNTKSVRGQVNFSMMFVVKRKMKTTEVVYWSEKFHLKLSKNFS